MNELSLFSGYGGFSMGLRLAGLDVRTVGYVEIDEYCQQLIQARIRDGLLDYAPILRDIRVADFRPMAGLVDIITAGFPCQPYSVAGQRRGEADERNLWPDTLRVIREVGPRVVLLENSSNLLHSPYWGTILSGLADCGLDGMWEVITACAVGAPHTRERVFLLAYTNSVECPSWLGLFKNGQKPIPTNSHRPVSGNWLDSITQYAGSGNGVAHRVDRLKALGNGIVPAVVARFLRG